MARHSAGLCMASWPCLWGAYGLVGWMEVRVEGNGNTNPEMPSATTETWIKCRRSWEQNLESLRDQGPFPPLLSLDRSIREPRAFGWEFNWIFSRAAIALDFLQWWRQQPSPWALFFFSASSKRPSWEGRSGGRLNKMTNSTMRDNVVYRWHG